MERKTIFFVGEHKNDAWDTRKTLSGCYWNVCICSFIYFRRWFLPPILVQRTHISWFEGTKSVLLSGKLCWCPKYHKGIDVWLLRGAIIWVKEYIINVHPCNAWYLSRFIVPFAIEKHGRILMERLRNKILIFLSGKKKLPCYSSQDKSLIACKIERNNI